MAAAREELLDTSPGWALPHPHSRLLTLEPLPQPEAARLVDALTGHEPVAEVMRERVVGTAGGNPLFLEQLVALRAEDGNHDGELPLPTTITALLAARLDRLPTAERDLLKRAAVEGLTFHRGPLTALLPDEEAADVGGLLLDAIRRNLIRSCQSQLSGDEGYEFVHILVRDAVYHSMPKELRADLHERFADTLEHTLGTRSGELDEILWLPPRTSRSSQARTRPTRPRTRRTGRQTGSPSPAGARSGVMTSAPPHPCLSVRSNCPVPTRLDVGLEVDLERTPSARPLRFRRCRSPTDLCQRARNSGDKAGEVLSARVVAAHYRFVAGEIELDELDARARTALPLLEQAEDHAGLVHVWYALGYMVANTRGRFDDVTEAPTRHSSARCPGEPLVRRGCLEWQLLATKYGGGPRSLSLLDPGDVEANAIVETCRLVVLGGVLGQDARCSARHGGDQLIDQLEPDPAAAHQRLHVELPHDRLPLIPPELRDSHDRAIVIGDDDTPLRRSRSPGRWTPSTE